MKLALLILAITFAICLVALGWQPLKSFAADCAEELHENFKAHLARQGLMLFAVVNTKSTTVTNRDATPAVINDGRLERGSLRSSIGSVAVGAADSATSYYPLVSVPTTAMVRAVLATSVTGMTTLAGDIGVYKTTANNGGVTTGVAANTGSGSIFAAAFSFATLKERAEATNTGTAYPTNLREQPLWQAIGLAADPGGFFDIGVKVTTANTGAAGRLGLEVQYVDNGT